jgi:hypothetical protein
VSEHERKIFPCPKWPFSYCAITAETLTRQGLEGDLETVQAAFKEFKENATQCPNCGHVIRWGEAKLQAQKPNPKS